MDKLISETSLPQPYITTIEQNSLITYDSGKDSIANFLAWLATVDVKPTFIGLYGAEISALLCPETKNYKKPHDTKLDKWAGSLLISPFFYWPHYCVPLWTVQSFFIDYGYRDIYKFIDIGHIAEEYAAWSSSGSLAPLPVYSINANPTFTEVVDWLNYCRNAAYVSADIETIRAPKGRRDSAGAETSGHMYTIALAPNTRESLAFQLWQWNRQQRVRIWQGLNNLLKVSSVIGQNYFQFDAHYEEAYGLEPNLAKIHDTRLRHQLLWPELPHSLQFQCRQYTRQKFYKDEGKTWKPSQLGQLLNYNALDTLVTYKIFEEQEKEFDERRHLR